MAKVLIDGREFETEGMSEEALAQLRCLRFVQNKITEMELEAAALQTAQNAYAAELRRILDIKRPETEVQMAENISFEE